MFLIVPLFQAHWDEAVVFFFYLLVSNEELQSGVNFEGRLGFSCPVKTAMLVPRKVLIEFI